MCVYCVWTFIQIQIILYCNIRELQYYSVWYDLKWYGILWNIIGYDVLWCDVIWCDIWHDMAWYDMYNGYAVISYDVIYDINGNI